MKIRNWVYFGIGFVLLLGFPNRGRSQECARFGATSNQLTSAIEQTLNERGRALQNTQAAASQAQMAYKNFTDRLAISRGENATEEDVTITREAAANLDRVWQDALSKSEIALQAVNKDVASRNQYCGFVVTVVAAGCADWTPAQCREYKSIDVVEQYLPGVKSKISLFSGDWRREGDDNFGGPSSETDEQAQCTARYEEHAPAHFASMGRYEESLNPNLDRFANADVKTKRSIATFEALYARSQAQGATTDDILAAKSMAKAADRDWSTAHTQFGQAVDNVRSLKAAREVYCQFIAGEVKAGCNTTTAAQCAAEVQIAQMDTLLGQLGERRDFYQNNWRTEGEYQFENEELECRARYEDDMREKLSGEAQGRADLNVVAQQYTSAWSQVQSQISSYRDQRTRIDFDTAAGMAADIDSKWSELAAIRTRIMEMRDDYNRSNGLICRQMTQASRCNFKPFPGCGSGLSAYWSEPSGLIVDIAMDKRLESDWRTEEDKKVTQCKAEYLAVVAPDITELDRIEADIAIARIRLRGLQDEGVYLREDYQSMRESNDMFAARQLALELDEKWSQTREQQKDIIAMVEVGRTKSRQMCESADRAAQNGCIWVSRNGCLADEGRMPTWESLLLEQDLSTQRYAQTWRGDADLDIENKSDAECAANLPKFNGTVVFLKGRAVVERGIMTLPVEVGTVLETGDKLNVEEASQVSIQMYQSGIIKITEMTSFLIPPLEVTPPKKTGLSAEIDQMLSDAWLEAKKLLKGECFELKTPTATAGVRG